MAEITATAEILKPKTDLTTTVGKEVVVYFRKPEELAPLNLPTEGDQTLRCRLVGYDRQGIWVEPEAWLKQALKDETHVSHIFLCWENVLSILRVHQTESFVSKKEYRGLRPSS